MGDVLNYLSEFIRFIDSKIITIIKLNQAKWMNRTIFKMKFRNERIR